LRLTFFWVGVVAINLPFFFLLSELVAAAAADAAAAVVASKAGTDQRNELMKQSADACPALTGVVVCSST
jgi:hypothetical protein